MGVEFRPVLQGRWLLADKTFEAEQKREVTAPLDGGFGQSGVEFGDCGVERPAAGRTRNQGLGTVPVQQERLTREFGRTLDVFL